MRVSELVKSFEHIASSPRSEASRAELAKHHDAVSTHDNVREEHLETDDARNELETRESDTISNVDSNDEDVTETNDESLIDTVSNGSELTDEISVEVLLSKDQQVVDSNVTETNDEGLIGIVSNSSELTDEISVEIPLSKDYQDSTFDQHHGESDNTLKFQCSELTDEIDFDNTVAHEIERESDNTQHQGQIENAEVSDYDSPGGAVICDETTSRVSYVHVDTESRDAVHSTNQNTICNGEVTNERFALDTCDESIEKVPAVDLDLNSSPVLEKCIVPKLHNAENAAPSDDNCLALASSENSNDKNLHDLIKEMELSMDERFRRLEETCEQIPLILEQLQRYANDAKHVPVNDFGSQSIDQASPFEILERNNAAVSKIDDILKTTSTESIENDVSIMTSFPELRAYVHQLESTSKNVIANVLDESAKADEQVLVDETPFDEAAVLDNDNGAPLSASMSSSELIDSTSNELLSKEIESLARGDEDSGEHGANVASSSSSSTSSSTSSELEELNDNEMVPKEIQSSRIDVERNDQSRPLDSVLSNCSSMLALEVAKPDPSEALHQIVSFLDDQHANFDRVCWGIICSRGQFEDDELE